MREQYHVEIRNPDWSIGGSATFDHDAAELLRRLNAYDELVSALEALMRVTTIGDVLGSEEMKAARNAGRAILAKLD